MPWRSLNKWTSEKYLGKADMLCPTFYVRVVPQSHVASDKEPLADTQTADDFFCKRALQAAINVFSGSAA